MTDASGDRTGEIKVDLHLHTLHSDGTLTPTEMVELCAERGLRVIAITDHDSTEGVQEAIGAAGRLGLTLIPGIELSSDSEEGEVHVLGYFVDCDDPVLQSTLKTFRDGREERGRLIVERLKELGMDIAWERVVEISDGGAVGRPHIAKAMVEQGYVEYPKDAFDQYLGRDGPAYVGRARLSPDDAVRMLVKNGAVPAMAHPTFFMQGSGPDGPAKLGRLLSSLKNAGLAGMEVHYGGYTPEEVDMLAKVAVEMDLIPCGGSDYHESGNPDEPEPGSAGPPMSTIQALERARPGRLVAS